MADDNDDRWPPPGPPAAGDEVATLLGSLERQRAIFAWKCGGLDAAGMKATVGASSMTLGGLVKHVTLVEADYFSRRLWGRDPGAPWNTVDWDADPDWEWRTAADDEPDELLRGGGDRRRRRARRAPGGVARDGGPLACRSRRGAGRRWPRPAGRGGVAGRA